MLFGTKRTYLDAAAGWDGPSPRRSWLWPRGGGNPSSPHAEGREAKKRLEEARAAIARLLEVQAEDVIFTSGATESNALAILGLVRACRMRDLRSPSFTPHVLYLPSAHASIVENVKQLEAEGAQIEELPIKNCQVDCEALANLLRPDPLRRSASEARTVLVTMEAVCGETGVIWNTREVARALSEFVTPSFDDGVTNSKHGRAWLHVDASQAPLTEKVTRAHFGADLLSLDGSKVGAPRGIGALIAHRTIPLAPLYRGGGQERGVRAGSESPQMADALAEALSQTAAGREAFRSAAEKARAALVSRLADIPDMYINECSAPGRQAPNILNLSLPGRDTDYLAALLDEAGFAVSTRSACETDSEDGSRAVSVLFGNEARARSTLRISWSADNIHNSFNRFADALARAVAFVDSNESG